MVRCRAREMRDNVVDVKFTLVGVLLRIGYFLLGSVRKNKMHIFDL